MNEHDSIDANKTLDLLPFSHRICQQHLRRHYVLGEHDQHANYLADRNHIGDYHRIPTFSHWICRVDLHWHGLHRKHDQHADYLPSGDHLGHGHHLLPIGHRICHLDLRRLDLHGDNRKHKDRQSEWDDEWHDHCKNFVIIDSLQERLIDIRFTILRPRVRPRSINQLAAPARQLLLVGKHTVREQ